MCIAPFPRSDTRRLFVLSSAYLSRLAWERDKAILLPSTIPPQHRFCFSLTCARHGNRITWSPKVAFLARTQSGAFRRRQRVRGTLRAGAVGDVLFKESRRASWKEDKFFCFVTAISTSILSQAWPVNIVRQNRLQTNAEAWIDSGL